MSKKPLFAPFAGWLIRPEWAERVVAGAYDAKTPEQRRAAVESNPYSYFGVTRSRDDAIEGDTPSDDDLLAKGAETLTRILDAGAFEPTGRPAFYVYRLTYGQHSQTGLVGALDVDGLFDGRVLTHENVRPKRARLLGRHLEVVGATSSPIALTHRVNHELQALLAEVACGEPDVDHLIEGVRHQIWTMDDAATERAAAMLSDETVYVTDGHHRSAAAVAGRDAHPDDPAFARTLAVLFPDEELRVEAFHRRAPRNAASGIDDLVAALSTVGTVEPVADAAAADPSERGQIGVYSDGNWWKLTLHDADHPTALDSLDVERLRRRVIGEVMGVDELGAKSGVDYVPAPTGVDELVSMCDADGAVGFLVYPTDIADLMAVAEAGDLMPPKSSYFAPKPRSGIFLRVLGCGATSHLPPS